MPRLVAKDLLHCSQSLLHVEAVLLVLVEVGMVGDDIVALEGTSGGAEHHGVPVIGDVENDAGVLLKGIEGQRLSHINGSVLARHLLSHWSQDKRLQAAKATLL